MKTLLILPMIIFLIACGVVEEEVTKTLNTAKEGHKTSNGAPLLVGSVVNELGGYEDITESKDHCLVKYFAGTVVILTIIYLLTQ